MPRMLFSKANQGRVKTFERFFILTERCGFIRKTVDV